MGCKMVRGSRVESGNGSREGAESGDDIRVGANRVQLRAWTPSSCDLGQVSPTPSSKIFLSKMKMIMPITQSHACLAHRNSYMCLAHREAAVVIILRERGPSPGSDTVTRWKSPIILGEQAGKCQGRDRHQTPGWWASMHPESHCYQLGPMV